jgi:hypothetical protein
MLVDTMSDVGDIVVRPEANPPTPPLWMASLLLDDLVPGQTPQPTKMSTSDRVRLSGLYNEARRLSINKHRSEIQHVRSLIRHKMNNINRSDSRPKTLDNGRISESSTQMEQSEQKDEDDDEFNELISRLRAALFLASRKQVYWDELRYKLVKWMNGVGCSGMGWDSSVFAPTADEVVRLFSANTIFNK